MASMKFSGNASFQTGTLGSSYTSGGGTLSLTSGHGSRFPSSGDFWVRVEDEIFKCTSRSGDTLTVSGAQDGTSAANHSSGATVRWVLGASSLTQVYTDLGSVYDTFDNVAALSPDAGAVGKMAFTSDGPYVGRWNGSAWQWFLPGLHGIAHPPPSSGWSWVNQGSSTLDTTGGSHTLVPQNSTTDLRLRVRSVSAPYTIDIALFQMVRTYHAGVVFRESGSGKIQTVSLNGQTAGVGITLEKYDSPTAYNSQLLSTFYGAAATVPPFIIRLVDDSTNRKVLMSGDGGKTFSLILSEGRTTFLTADQVGFYGTSSAVPDSVTILSWHEH